MTPKVGEVRGSGLGEFLAVLMRRKLIWIPIFCIVLALSLYTYMTSAVYFESHTKLLVSRGERESSLNPRVYFLQWEEELASEVETVYSEPVRVIAERKLLEADFTDVNGDPLKIIPADLSAAPVRGSNVLEIVYKATVPDHAVRCVTALTEAYMEYRKATKGIPEVDGYFRTRLQEVRAALDERTDEKKRILQSAGVADIDEQRLETIEVFGDVRLSLVKVREQLAFAGARLQALRDFRDSGLSHIEYIPIFMGDELRDDGALTRLVETMIDLQTRETQLESRYTATNPLLLEVREQIEGHRRLIREAADRYEGVLLAKLETWQARETLLADEAAALEEELRAYPERASELERVDVEISALETDYQRLINESTVAGIQNASAPSWNVRLYASASQPKRLQTGDVIRTLVVPIFALLIAVGLAFAVDGMDPSVKTVTEAEAIFDAPVLASVARVGRK